ncbi:MAG TPA: transglutaminase family protein [Microvirga sp.]|jgi:transglutaminase-like putative cysteine protease|nr:transglutaminase family protein [Microvirga sp.]
MRVRITHETVYTYERPVRGLIQHLRLTPRDHDGQHVLRWRIEPSADGRLKRGEDAFGNVLHTFSADGPVEELTVRVLGEVETNEMHGVVRGTVERLPDPFYLRETDLTLADAEIRSFVESLSSAIRRDPLAGLHSLLGALHREVTFDTGPTHSATTAAEAFALRRGVCQDLTHIFIAAARHLGIPARYVSGYFHRADGVTDQDAGHAWVEAKVPGLGWVGFDPANGISTGEAHVRVAAGLDYLGAAPVRGSRYGGGSEKLDVTLTVEAGQSQSQSQWSALPLEQAQIGED